MVEDVASTADLFEIIRTIRSMHGGPSVTVCVVAPTPLQRFDEGALMGDVLLSAFRAAFGFSQGRCF
jgi:hypothetical protein